MKNENKNPLDDIIIEDISSEDLEKRKNEMERRAVDKFFGEEGAYKKFEVTHETRKEVHETLNGASNSLENTLLQLEKMGLEVSTNKSILIRTLERLSDFGVNFVIEGKSLFPENPIKVDLTLDNLNDFLRRGAVILTGVAAMLPNKASAFEAGKQYEIVASAMDVNANMETSIGRTIIMALILLGVTISAAGIIWKIIANRSKVSIEDKADYTKKDVPPSGSSDAPKEAKLETSKQKHVPPSGEVNPPSDAPKEAKLETLEKKKTQQGGSIGDQSSASKKTEIVITPEVAETVKRTFKIYGYKKGWVSSKRVELGELQLLTFGKLKLTNYEKFIKDSKVGAIASVTEKAFLKALAKDGAKAFSKLYELLEKTPATELCLGPIDSPADTSLEALIKKSGAKVAFEKEVKAKNEPQENDGEDAEKIQPTETSLYCDNLVQHCGEILLFEDGKIKIANPSALASFLNNAKSLQKDITSEELKFLTSLSKGETECPEHLRTYLAIDNSGICLGPKKKDSKQSLYQLLTGNFEEKIAEPQLESISLFDGSEDDNEKAEAAPNLTESQEKEVQKFDITLNDETIGWVTLYTSNKIKVEMDTDEDLEATINSLPEDQKNYLKNASKTPFICPAGIINSLKNNYNSKLYLYDEDVEVGNNLIFILKEAGISSAPKLNFTNDDLNQIFQDKQFSPEKLISLLKKQYSETYEQGVGVDGGYTLEQHTLMVMNQFEKYFADTDLPSGIDKNMFRLILALHDIGKPEAISKEGKHLQHEYTQQYIQSLFEALSIDKKYTELALMLASGDPIGKYLKNKINIEEAKKIIQEMAKKAKIPVNEFFELLCIYFKVDAGSYTKNAGATAKYVLDSLFDFDEKNHNLNFAPSIQTKIDELGFKKSEDSKNLTGNEPEKNAKNQETEVQDKESIEQQKVGYFLVKPSDTSAKNLAERLSESYDKHKNTIKLNEIKTPNTLESVEGEEREKIVKKIVESQAEYHKQKAKIRVDGVYKIGEINPYYEETKVKLGNCTADWDDSPHSPQLLLHGTDKSRGCIIMNEGVNDVIEKKYGGNGGYKHKIDSQPMFGSGISTCARASKAANYFNEGGYNLQGIKNDGLIFCFEAAAGKVKDLELGIWGDKIDGANWWEKYDTIHAIPTREKHPSDTNRVYFDEWTIARPKQIRIKYVVHCTSIPKSDPEYNELP